MAAEEASSAGSRLPRIQQQGSPDRIRNWKSGYDRQPEELRGVQTAQ